MKNPLLTSCLFALVLALLATAPAHAVQGRPSAISFVDADSDRHIYAFVKGDNGHLVSNHFDGTSWVWTDHGLPAGAASISNPKAVTYVDSVGNRRIYVFAVDSSGKLVIRYHKGAGFAWQWSNQAGPTIYGSTLSATTFVDDTGVRRMYAFAFRTNPGGAIPYRMVTHFWNGNGWSWADMPVHATHAYSHLSFTDVTTYIGNDGRRRMDVFCEAGDSNVLLRHSWVESAWNLTNLGGQAQYYASSVNYTNSSGYRQVHTFARHPAYLTIWDRHGATWEQIGAPAGMIGTAPGFISATAYQDSDGFPRMNVFAEWDGRLYLRSWINNSWQSWTNLGRPSSSPDDDVKNTAAITYLESRGGDRHTWVFMTGAENRLYVNFWNGESWQWYNRGNP
jgi:hypothetical protein